MNELVTNPIECELDELEPVVLAAVTDITSSGGSGEGDFQNVVWANEP
jgi:hypothetical protein